MTFDEQVAALRGKVVPKFFRSKADCTPEEWAAKLDYVKAWAKDNPEKNQAAKKAWKKDNPEKFRATVKAWRKTHPDKHRTTQKKWRKKRYHTDPVYRLLRCLRSRQSDFFKGKSRSLSMVRDMGCSQEFFKQHIIGQLTGDMTLENHGKVWHLDHIYPLSKADLTDRVQFLAAANWRNLQPMLGPENKEKSDEITPEAQVLFDELVREFATRLPSS